MREKHTHDILEILHKLKPHERFEIEWVDASESRVTRIDLPIPNHTVETRQLEMGYFLCLQKGDTWHDLHLIYYLKSVDKDSRGPGQWNVTSIPVYLIKRIVPLTKKEALKESKNGEWLRRMRSRRHRRHTQRFSDGSVKYVD
jgi:hypothetical protein